jgi:hypothetical protein
VEAELAELKKPGKKKSDAVDDDADDDDAGDGKGKGKQKSKAGQNGGNNLTIEQIQELLEKRDKDLMEKIDAKVGKVSDTVSQKEVDDYRKEQIEKYHDVLIPNLVPTGLKTKDEVNKSIQNALTTSKSYIVKETTIGGTKGRYTLAEIEAAEAKDKEKQESGSGNNGNNNSGGKTQSYQGGNYAGKPDSGSGDVSGKELLKRVDELTDAEYEKNRDQILREAKAVKYPDEE